MSNSLKRMTFCLGMGGFTGLFLALRHTIGSGFWAIVIIGAIFWTFVSYKLFPDEDTLS